MKLPKQGAICSAIAQAPRTDSNWPLRLALAGVPVSLVQKQLGHSSPDITSMYYMPDDLDELRALMDKFGLVKTLLEDEVEDVEEEAEGDEDEVEGLETGD